MADSQDLYVNTSSRMILRPESPLRQAYGGSNPPGTHIVGGVVTSTNGLTPGGAPSVPVFTDNTPGCNPPNRYGERICNDGVKESPRRDPWVKR